MTKPTFTARLLAAAILISLFSSLGVARVHADDDSVQEQVKKQTVMQRMQNLLKQVKLEKVPAEDAFKWWRSNSQIPLVINWDQLRDDGVSDSTPVTIDLEMIPCHQALRLIMQQVSAGRPMVVEITPWYVEVLTKAAANERLITRTYRVRDLLWGPNDRVPRDDDDDDKDDGDRDKRSSKGDSQKDRVEQLLDVIRTSIEPDIWKENGGESSLNYRNGQLIVRAPLYVHNQLEAPEVSKPVAPARPKDDEKSEKEAEKKAD